MELAHTVALEENSGRAAVIVASRSAAWYLLGPRTPQPPAYRDTTLSSGTETDCSETAGQLRRCVLLGGGLQRKGVSRLSLPSVDLAMSWITVVLCCALIAGACAQPVAEPVAVAAPELAPVAPPSNGTHNNNGTSAPNGTTPVAAAGSCDSFSSGCADCSGQWQCVWCPNTKKCVDGMFYGPTGGGNVTAECDGWQWRQCNRTSTVNTSEFESLTDC